MSTPSSIPPYGAELRAPVAPYSLPGTGGESADLGAGTAQPQVRPYVPGPWRGTPAIDKPSPFSAAAVTPSVALDSSTRGVATSAAASAASATVPPLPWIDAFLSSTPVLPMRAVAEPVVAEPAPAVGTPLALDAIPSSEAWALDEAAERMRALAEALLDHEGIASTSLESARGFDGVSLRSPLPAWNDDDVIDLMPLRPDRAVPPDRWPNAASSGAHQAWADRVRRVDDDNAEAGAQALELLARRVRDGEIVLAGYEPRLGDAAALAAALAALLGVRR